MNADGQLVPSWNCTLDALKIHRYAPDRERYGVAIFENYINFLPKESKFSWIFVVLNIKIFEINIFKR